MTGKISGYLLPVPLGAALAVSLNITINLSHIGDIFTGCSRDMQGDIYSGPVMAGIMTYCILIPFFEELIFRKLIYGLMRRMLPSTASMLISALIFGIYHWNIVQSMYAAILGMALAFIYERYGRIWAPFAVHAAGNLVIFLTAVYCPGAAVFNREPYMIITASVTAAAAIVLLHGADRKEAE